MKEQEKAEIKQLSDQLEALKRKIQSLLDQGQLAQASPLIQEQESIEAELTRLRAERENKLSKEARNLKQRPFSRPITKKEQANLGALKKSVRGIVIVHPMTALGREMALKEMMGFANQSF